MAWNDSMEALKGLVADAAQAAARVTRSAAAATKSNIGLLAEQEKLKKAYQALGKLYYRDYITGEEPDEAEYLPLCDAITEATKSIDALRGDLEEVKSAFLRSVKPTADEEAVEEVPAAEPDLESELAELDQQLNELNEKLAEVRETTEEVKGVVFEVVEDRSENAEEAPRES